MLKVGNAVGKTAVLKSLNILLILLLLLFLTQLATVSYSDNDKEIVLKVTFTNTS